MSRVSSAPQASDRKRPPGGGLRVIRPALVGCAVFCCALAAPGLLPTRTDGLLRAAAPDPAPKASQDELSGPQVSIEASASSVNVCPDAEPRTRVTLAARGVSKECQPRYGWSVTGGRVEGTGPSVVWNLSGAPPGRGFYEATVTVETSAACGARRRSSATWRVVAGRCPPRITSWSYAARTKPTVVPVSCPNIALCCRATARPGQRDVPFSAELKGGTPGASPSFRWTILGGRLTGGQGTEAVSVRTGEAGGRNVLARVEVGGYGTAAPCSATCVTELVTPSSPLRVLVRDSKAGRPVRGAQVTVRGQDGERVFPTDEGGNFERADFEPRHYLVRVNAPGFNEQEKSVNLGESHGGSVFFSLVPSYVPEQRPTPAPTPEVAATPSPTPSPEEVSPSPTPAPTAPPPPPPPPECAGCCLLDLDGRECQLVALVGLAVLGVGALCAGAAFSLWGLDGGLATVKADEVHCTVFAPFEAPPGDCFFVQVFAHLARHASRLADLADDVDPDAQKRNTKVLNESIRHGKTLTFALQMPGLVDEAMTDSLVWNGEINSVAFNVTIPEDFKPRSLAGTVTIAYGSVPVGHISFKFKVAAKATQPAQDTGPATEPCLPRARREAPEQKYVRYRRAFISYASEDRDRVVPRVQMLEAAEVEFFHDLLDLKPGERWEPALYRYLQESDVVFLFWSEAAKKSKWVKKEIEYALDLRKDDPEDDIRPVIIPIVIEKPSPSPPRDLKQFHFSDKYLHFIHEEAAPSRPSKKSRAKSKPNPRKRAST